MNFWYDSAAPVIGRPLSQTAEKGPNSNLALYIVVAYQLTKEPRVGATPIHLSAFVWQEKRRH